MPDASTTTIADRIRPLHHRFEADMVLLALLEELAGPHPHSGPMWDFLSRDEPVTDEGRFPIRSINRDCFVGPASGGGFRWGAVIGPRFNDESSVAHIMKLYAALGGSYPLSLGGRIRTMLPRELFTLLALHYAPGDRRPDWAFTVVEPSWGADGVTLGAARRLLETNTPELGFPDDLDDEAPCAGLGMRGSPEGDATVEIVLGAESPAQAWGSATPPPPAADRLETPAGWAYKVLRLRRDAPVTASLSRVWLPDQLVDREQVEAAWSTVESCWNAADASESYGRLRAALAGRRDILPVPTGLELFPDEPPLLYLCAWFREGEGP